MTGDPLEIRCRHGVPSGRRGIVMPEDEHPSEACPECQIANRLACGCNACANPPGTMFLLMPCCPTCGNKRCPRGTDHRLDCSGSNEQGQPGSLYQVSAEDRVRDAEMDMRDRFRED